MCSSKPLFCKEKSCVFDRCPNCGLLQWEWVLFCFVFLSDILSVISTHLSLCLLLWRLCSSSFGAFSEEIIPHVFVYLLCPQEEVNSGSFYAAILSKDLLKTGRAGIFVAESQTLF